MNDNVSAIFSTVRKSATKLGSCDPLWLKNGQVPVFTTHGAADTGIDFNEEAFFSQDLEKPPMLLLHGLFGALSNWHSTIPLFKSFSRPLALQLPILTGHRSEVKVKSLAVFTEFFIRSRDLQPLAICGNSLGGHVALRLCLTSPELVDCLILSGASGLYEHSVDALPIRPDQRFVRSHMERVFVNQRFVTDDAIEEIYAILKSKANVLNLIHAARSAKKDNLLDLLPNIKVPTLLLWGEDDTVTTMDVAETFHKNIPNSELVTIKNCGHAPMIEHPEWFSEQVERFLRKHSRCFKDASCSAGEQVRKCSGMSN